MRSDSAAPLTYLITDGTTTRENLPEKTAHLLELIEVAVEENISFVQIREKNLTAREVFALTKKAVEITQKSATKLLVNDRADIALAAQADGVHLTANSISAKLIRQNFLSELIIGVSAHNETEIKNAIAGESDFAVFSPIFPTISKEKYGAPQGVRKLREMCEKYAPFPLLALGGINEENFAECLPAGAKGIAGISIFNDKIKLPKIVQQIREARKQQQMTQIKQISR